MDKILIIVDRADNKQVALARGIELALALNAEVEAIAFTHETLSATTIDASSEKKIKDYLINDHQQWLKHQLDKVARPGLNITGQVVWSNQLHQWITGHCQQHDYLAVVKTATRSSSVYHTSTDWHLLRECPAALLLVAEKKWRKARPILAALDLSTKKPAKLQLNQLILKTAADYAAKLNHELHVVHVLHVSTLLKDLDIIDIKALTARKKVALKPVIEGICAHYNLPSEHVHIRAGLAHKAIPSVADKIKADLVVMGTVGAHGLSARILGSTAEKVLAHLRTDVLALKPEPNE